MLDRHHPPPRVPRALSRRRAFGVAATALTTIGLFAAFSSGESVLRASAPSTTGAAPSAVASPPPAVDTGFPSIELAPAVVGDADATRATFTETEDGAFIATGQDMTVVGDDVSIQYTAKDGDTFEVTQETRIIGGRWYNGMVGEDGEWTWTAPPEDAEPIEGAMNMLPPDPRTMLAALAPVAGFESEGMELRHGDTANPEGIETEHLVATTPEALTDEAWPGSIHSPVTAMDVWVDSNGFVRRISWSSTVSYDITSYTDGCAPPTLPADSPPTASFPPEPDCATTSVESVDVASLYDYSDIGSAELAVEIPDDVQPNEPATGDLPETTG